MSNLSGETSGSVLHSADSSDKKPVYSNDAWLQDPDVPPPYKVTGYGRFAPLRQVKLEESHRKWTLAQATKDWSEITADDVMYEVHARCCPWLDENAMLPLNKRPVKHDVEWMAWAKSRTETEFYNLLNEMPDPHPVVPSREPSALKGMLKKIKDGIMRSYSYWDGPFLRDILMREKWREMDTMNALKRLKV